MRQILLGAVAIMSLSTLVSLHAAAAPFSDLAGIHASPAHSSFTNVYWDRHHRYWRHRRWGHGHWHYW